MKDNKKIMGITGLIGSGKTTAGNYFKKKGAFFIDADIVVHELYGPGKAGSLRISSFLGDEYLRNDQSVNRMKLARFVLNDVNKMKILNNLIHPLVFDNIKKMIRGAENKTVVIEAAYFSKKWLGKLITKLIFIDCPMNTLVKRVRFKSAERKRRFVRMLEIQREPLEYDYLVDNGKSLRNLFKQLDILWEMNV